jgi:hypothetical protein
VRFKGKKDVEKKETLHCRHYPDFFFACSHLHANLLTNHAQAWPK